MVHCVELGSETASGSGATYRCAFVKTPSVVTGNRPRARVYIADATPGTQLDLTLNDVHLDNQPALYYNIY